MLRTSATDDRVETVLWGGRLLDSTGVAARERAVVRIAAGRVVEVADASGAVPDGAIDVSAATWGEGPFCSPCVHQSS